jgi:uncharacterized protein
VTAARRSASEWAGWVEPIYLDSSALVKLFVAEEGSGALNLAILGAEDVIIADLTLTEMASALGRRMREGRVTRTESRILYQKAAEMAASYRRLELTPPIHRRAERLMLTSAKVPLRGLDALHLASALDADAATVVSYDLRLREAAASHGLFVAPSVV